LIPSGSEDNWLKNAIMSEGIAVAKRSKSGDSHRHDEFRSTSSDEPRPAAGRRAVASRGGLLLAHCDGGLTAAADPRYPPSGARPESRSGSSGHRAAAIVRGEFDTTVEAASGSRPDSARSSPRLIRARTAPDGAPAPVRRTELVLQPRGRAVGIRPRSGRRPSWPRARPSPPWARATPGGDRLDDPSARGRRSSWSGIASIPPRGRGSADSPATRRRPELDLQGMDCIERAWRPPRPVAPRIRAEPLGDRGDPVDSTSSERSQDRQVDWPVEPGERHDGDRPPRTTGVSATWSTG